MPLFDAYAATFPYATPRRFSLLRHFTISLMPLFHATDAMRHVTNVGLSYAIATPMPRCRHFFAAMRH